MPCFKQASAAKKRTLLTGRRRLTLCYLRFSYQGWVKSRQKQHAALCHRAALPGFASFPVLSRTAENATTPSYIVTSVLGVNASSRSTNKDQNELFETGAG